MIQPVAPRPKSFSEVPAVEVEAAFRRGIREVLVRNAKLGFPAVGSENGQIVHWSPERVLKEFAAEVAQSNAADHN